MWTFKLICIVLVLCITFVSGIYPFFKKAHIKKPIAFPIGESLAAGVFLGAALIHMLGDSALEFFQLHFQYPWAFLIAGSTFLFFLLMEHISREVYHKGNQRSTFAIMAVIMLSIHSFLTGAALGVTKSFSLSVIILLAILAHKWAASFALAVQINKSELSLKTGILLFLIFATMVPLGIIFGTFASEYFSAYPLIVPIFTGLAAGTFLYLGTLHGLEQAVLIKQCCNLNLFIYMILGFILMAVIAIWV